MPSNNSINNTIADNDFSVIRTTAGTTTQCVVSHTDAVSATSHAKIESLAQPGGGDPYYRWRLNGGTQYAMGIDNSDSDKLKITDSSDPSSGNTIMVITSAGEITMPLTPAFSAYLGSSDANATGAGTNYVFGGTTALTEIFDQNGDFVTTGTFTAPVTGRYYFNISVSISNLAAAMTTGTLYIATSNRTYTVAYLNIYADAAATGPTFRLRGGAFADMDALDTATFNITVNGGAGDTATIDGSAQPGTGCSGYLAC